MTSSNLSLFPPAVPHTERIGRPAAAVSIGEIERACASRGESLIIGVDEAGRGPLAGPVAAAAVAFAEPMYLQDKELFAALNDSKKMNEADRDALFELIQDEALAWAIVFSDRETIDQINILQATKRAMVEAITQVCATLGDRRPDRVYIDGNQTLDVSMAQTTVVKGDARSWHIAAASVLAKVERDRAMRALDTQWPGYGFAQHKGYGTAQHRQAIADLGPCPHHRQGFAGVREHLDRLRPEPSP